MLLKEAKSGVALPMESAMKIFVRAWKRLARTPLKFSLPVASAIGALMVASAAMAQTYPSKLIKVIAAVSSGSPIDVTARLVTTDLSNRFAQPVIVENRPGGGGTIGVGEFAKAIDLTFDGSGNGLGTRSKRYAMLVEDGVVKKLNIEEAPGKVEVSGGDALLKQL